MSSKVRNPDLQLDFYNNIRQAKLREKIAALLRVFEGAGALELHLPALLDSNVLIDLYGEDIRNRAYTATDTFGSKKILRPDFTVPIVQLHIATKKKEAKYSYSGSVWRSQPHESKKPSEYHQVGFEYFHEIEAWKADAQVFELFYRSLKGIELHTDLGDMGIIRAIVKCLDISDTKRRLLLRHLWRPARFKQLLSQLSTGDSITDPKAMLFRAVANEKAEDYIKENGPIMGKRSIDEIIARSKDLMRAESKKPISKSAVLLIEKIQTLQSSLVDAPKNLTEFFHLGSEIVEVCDNLARRIQSMTELGVNVNELNFVANLTRTSLEYYDGFIFISSVKGASFLPPVAQGGRYDALTSILGKGKKIPAVGGIIRPEILSFLDGDA